MATNRAKYNRVPGLGIYDLRGEQFGGLTAMAPCCKLGVKRTTTYWNCLCECGKQHIAGAADLINAKTQSCGCLHQKTLLTHSFAPVHGGTGTRLHRIWKSMKARCYLTTHRAYRYYGGRGIVVCSKWKDSFEAFRDWALSSGYADDLTIDRQDSDKGYSPENCRWITKAENGGRSRRQVS